MGKSTISMAIFNSYVSHYQRVATATLLPCFLMLFVGSDLRMALGEVQGSESGNCWESGNRCFSTEMTMSWVK